MPHRTSHADSVGGGPGPAASRRASITIDGRLVIDDLEAPLLEPGGRCSRWHAATCLASLVPECAGSPRTLPLSHRPPPPPHCMPHHCMPHHCMPLLITIELPALHRPGDWGCATAPADTSAQNRRHSSKHRRHRCGRAATHAHLSGSALGDPHLPDGQLPAAAGQGSSLLFEWLAGGVGQPG